MINDTKILPGMDLGMKGINSATMAPSFGPFSGPNIDMLKPSVWNDGPFDPKNVAMLKPTVAPNAKSDWEMDDDTIDFLTDAFNTLNQEDEFLGGGGSGGGGSGGGGGSFSGGPGSEHSTTWKFGGSRFKPQGIF